MRFSRRTNWESRPNRLSRAVEEVRRKGKDVIDLTESNPTRCGFSYPPQLLDAFKMSGNFTYDPQSRGLRRARESVARFYERQGMPVDSDHVFLTSSTSEAYFYLYRLLADVSDEVLFPQPGYPLFSFLADVSDVNMVRYDLNPDARWSIHREHLESRVSERTKAVTIVNPNNPTGQYVSGDDFNWLASICRDRQIPIISDEVFFPYALDDRASGQSALTLKEGDRFVLSGLSKLMGLPHMKLGWIVVQGKHSFVEEASRRLDVIADTFLSVNTPVQNALPEWMSFQDEMTRQIVERIRGNWAVLNERLTCIPLLRLLPAEGGWYAVIRVSGLDDDEEFVTGLVTQKYVLVHPGYFYDMVENGYLVFSLLLEPDRFQNGLAAFLDYVEEMKVNFDLVNPSQDM